MASPLTVTSRDNPLLAGLRKLARDPAAYRRLGMVWLEGEHLCSALLARGGRPRQAVLAHSAWAEPALRGLAQAAPQVVLLPDALFDGLSALPSPARLGFVLDTPQPPAIAPAAPSIVLDRLQDAGNVGSILRSASAFGVTQVLAMQGTAALWSPKVLRAGMGAHFALTLVEGATLADVIALGLPVVGTHLRDAQWLHETTLPNPLAWVFGHEGQGMGDAVSSACTLRVRIAQPGGEESLNVAAALAVCCYESARQRGASRP